MSVFLPQLQGLNVTPPPNTVTLWADLQGNVYKQAPNSAPVMLSTAGGEGTFTTITIGGTSTITGVSKASGTLGSTPITAGSYANISFEVPGATSADAAYASLGGALTNGIVIANVYTTTGSVIVTLFNTDLLSSQSPADQPVNITVITTA